MDLTKIDKPFGELDDATKGALLLAHHRGEVIEVSDGDMEFSYCDPSWIDDLIYRVRPNPVIGEVVLYGVNKTIYPLHKAPSRVYEEPFQRVTFTFPTRDGMHVPGVYTSPDGLQIKIEVAG